MLSRCVDHNHLCHIDDVVPVLLFCQKAFVDLELLKVNACKVLPLISALSCDSCPWLVSGWGSEELAVGLAQFLDEREYFLSVILVLELDQI